MITIAQTARRNGHAPGPVRSIWRWVDGLPVHARRRPERVPALVLQGLTVDPDARTGRQSVLRTMVNSSRESGVGIGPMLDYLQAGLWRAVLTGRYMLEDRVEHKLPKISQPALVIRGAKDPIVPQGWAEEVTRRLPGGRLLVIPGGAHTMVTVAALEHSPASSAHSFWR